MKKKPSNVSKDPLEVKLAKWIFNHRHSKTSTLREELIRLRPEWFQERTVWTVATAIEIAKKCKSRNEFRSKHFAACKCLLLHARHELDKIFPKSEGSLLTEIEILSRARKFQTRSQLKTGDTIVYHWLVRNEKLHLLDSFMPPIRRGPRSDIEKMEFIKKHDGVLKSMYKDNGSLSRKIARDPAYREYLKSAKAEKWTKKSVLAEANRHATLKIFRRSCSGAYSAALENDWMAELLQILPQARRQKWTLPEAVEVAREHSNRRSLQIANSSVYAFLLKRHPKVLDKILPSTITKWTKAAAIREMGKYTTITDFTKRGGGAYMWLTKNGLQHLVHQYLTPKFERWTKKEIEYLIQKREQMTLPEIAKALGRTYSSVTAKADKLGVRTVRRKHWLESEEQELVRTVKSGLSDQEIAHKLNRTKYAVTFKRLALGLVTRQSLWTDKEDALILGTSKKNAEIARITGRTARAVSARRILLRDKAISA